MCSFDDIPEQASQNTIKLEEAEFFCSEEEPKYIGKIVSIKKEKENTTLIIPKSTLRRLKLWKKSFSVKKGIPVFYEELFEIMMKSLEESFPDVYTIFKELAKDEGIDDTLRTPKRMTKARYQKMRGKLGYALFMFHGKEVCLPIHHGKYEPSISAFMPDYCRLPKPDGKNLSLTKIRKQFGEIDYVPSKNLRPIGYINDNSIGKINIYPGRHLKSDYCIINGKNTPFNEAKAMYPLAEISWKAGYDAPPDDVEEVSIPIEDIDL